MINRIDYLMQVLLYVKKDNNQNLTYLILETKSSVMWNIFKFCTQLFSLNYCPWLLNHFSTFEFNLIGPRNFLKIKFFADKKKTFPEQSQNVFK